MTSESRCLVTLAGDGGETLGGCLCVTGGGTLRAGVLCWDGGCI